MPIGTVPPPTAHPDEEPLVCFSINKEWITRLIGVIQPMKYPEYWSGTLEENRQARKDFGILLDQLMSAEDCNMAICCEPAIYIYRMNPDTGRFERSSDDGVTWLKDPADPIHSITQLTPIVTEGGSKTKCDAATNFLEHFEDIEVACSENIGTAITVFELAAALAAIIVDIIVAILTEGAGLIAAVSITDAIFAAAAAAFAEGKTLFDDYWTNERKDQILCAAYCTIGDNGQFSQVQWENFKHKVRAELTPGAALDFVMTSVNAGGYIGGSNMASYGSAALSDCSDCLCDCTLASWSIWNGTEDYGNIVSVGSDFIIAELSYAPATVGEYFLRMRTPANDSCCNISHVEIITGEDFNLSKFTICEVERGTFGQTLSFMSGTDGNGANSIEIGSPAYGKVKIFFI